MNIVVIGPTHPYKGGISHFTTILVEHLRQIHAVSLFSWIRQYPGFLYPVTINDSHSRSHIKTDAIFSLDILNPLTWFKTAHQIQQLQPDLLIMTWVTPLQGPVYASIASIVKRVKSVKIMYLCHNVNPHEHHIFDSLFQNLAWNFGDRFTVHSHTEKEALLKIKPNREIVVAFHPPYDQFTTYKTGNIHALQRQLKLKKRVLLFFGFIRKYKGLRYLLEAMPKIVTAYADTSLLIVGEFWSKDLPAYKQLIRKLGIQDHVAIVDQYVPNEAVGNYFALADLLVIPYISATQSGVTQIATAFNKPVISTDVGGLKETITPGVNGWLVPPKDADALAAAVIHFYTHGLPPNTHTPAVDKSWSRYINLITGNL